MPNPAYFIVVDYNNYICVQSKHLFVIEKLSLIGFTSFSFAQTTIHNFHYTLLNS